MNSSIFDLTGKEISMVAGGNAVVGNYTKYPEEPCVVENTKVNFDNDAERKGYFDLLIEWLEYAKSDTMRALREDTFLVVV